MPQARHVSLNIPFKDNNCLESNQWMLYCVKAFIKGCNMLAPPLDALCEKIVVKSWECVRVETVMKYFKKCRISNSMDGEEKYFLQQNTELGNSENSPDEFGISNSSHSKEDLFTSNDE